STDGSLRPATADATASKSKIDELANSRAGRGGNPGYRARTSGRSLGMVLPGRDGGTFFSGPPNTRYRAQAEVETGGGDVAAGRSGSIEENRICRPVCACRDSWPSGVDCRNRCRTDNLD